ncbi:MAG TPA: hypothetical protein VGD79_12180, partial [Thermoanaerobaculia bacterium]
MRRAAFAVLVLLAAAVTAGAQTADEIVQKYIRQSGGMERIQAVQTLRRTGTFFGGGGFEAKILEENKRPGRVRQEFALQGMTAITAWDGSNGWKIEPFGGKKDVENLSEDETKGILSDADFDGPLVNYQQKGNKVEYMGTEPVEGTDAHKLKVTLANGEVRYYYMDSDYSVPIKVETKRVIRGAEREFETTFGDYKSVNGWYLPHSIESGVKGSPFRQKNTYEKIEANVAIANTRFARPGTQAPADEPMPAASTVAAEAPAPVPAASSAAVKIDSDTISGLGARNIGSAAMSGRIAALDAVYEGQRLTIYVGAASGGVWKSVNGGTTFKPVFDKQPVQSIGAIAIDPQNPKIVWAGTGESWTRNSVSVGDGVYKSVDGGDNWTPMGLKESERITKIAVDPTDSNTVWVCVPGRLWSDSDERGVYKTTDAGKTWTKALKGANLSTGCSMLSLDAKNPKTVYAGMWDFRRKGWTFRSGGEGPNATSGSGLFKSTDGGATWTELDAKSATGLPSKPWGRVAVTSAPSNPDVVYALIEAEPPKNGLYRSADGGKTWQLGDRGQMVVWRPFYFANLIVDPKDENKVYKPNLSLIASNDGGKTFTNIGGATHGDHHVVWIDPTNTDHLITGDDGGLWYSYDAGKSFSVISGATHGDHHVLWIDRDNTDHLIAGDDGGLWYSYDGGNRWWKAENLPVSQFYHVSV